MTQFAGRFETAAIGWRGSCSRTGNAMIHRLGSHSNVASNPNLQLLPRPHDVFSTGRARACVARRLASEQFASLVATIECVQRVERARQMHRILFPSLSAVFSETPPSLSPRDGKKRMREEGVSIDRGAMMRRGSGDDERQAPSLPCSETQETHSGPG